MRILSINIEENTCKETIGEDFGIKSEIQMARLGKLVVLAGANGAGKSRLLKIITEFGNYYKKNHEPNLIKSKISEENKKLNENENRFTRYESQLQTNPGRTDLLEGISRSRSAFEQSKTNINAMSNKLATWRIFSTDPPETSFQPLFFIPTVSRLEDAERFTAHQIEESAKACKLGQGDSSMGVPSYLRFVMRRARNAKLALLEGENLEENKKAEYSAAKQDGISLAEIVKKLLGKRSNLDIDIDDHIKIFERQDFFTTLSEGQKILLKLAVQLHAQKTDLAKALIFLDEPENHLHPAVLNEVIDVLLEEVTVGQIWIATHSVTLISKLVFLDPACIWFMENETISHAGKNPELVLKGLLGEEKDIYHLREFTDLPAKLAANRYAAECLLDPTTVGPRTQDKQQQQMREVLLDTSQNKKLRILDFGAGQGRLLAALHEAGEIDSFDYIAVDIESKNNTACKMQIEKSYGTDGVKKRFFTDISKVMEYWSNVDIIVMCNVLHEISPDEWQTEIGPSSQIMELLKPNGFLLIIEDQRIPVGENAHNYGFLVFDTVQFQKLFDFTAEATEDLYKKYDAYQDIDGKAGRILAHRFAKDLVSRFSANNQKNAIISLYQTAARRMKEIRLKAKEENPTFQDGQLHGFWMTQLANTSLWLSTQGIISLANLKE